MSLRCLAPTLSLDNNMSLLASLCVAIFSKFKVLRTFLRVMRTVHLFLGGLDSHLLEVESIAQSLHYKLLLKALIEYH